MTHKSLKLIHQQRHSVARFFNLVFTLFVLCGFLTVAHAKGKPGGGGGGGKPGGGGSGDIPVSVVIDNAHPGAEIFDDGGGAYITNRDVKTEAEINGASGRLQVDTNTSKKKFSGRTVTLLLPSSVLYAVGIPGYANDPGSVLYMPEQVEIFTGMGPVNDLRNIPVGDTLALPLVIKTFGSGSGFSEEFWINYGGIDGTGNDVCVPEAPNWSFVLVTRTAEDTWEIVSNGPAVIHGAEFNNNGPCYGEHNVDFFMTVTEVAQ